MAKYFIGEIKPYKIKSKNYQGFCFRYKSPNMKAYRRKVAKNKKELNLIRNKMTYEFKNNDQKKEYQDLTDDCYEGYIILEDNPLSKEDWIKLPQAKQFINKMKKKYKLRAKLT